MENCQPKINETTFAKYFVQKSGFLNTSKRILIINSESLTLCPFKTITSPDESFRFDDIASIEVLSRNDREFCIKTKKNTSITLYCVLRTQCLCEIYHAWDTYNAKNSRSKFASEPQRTCFKCPTFQASQLISTDGKTFLETDIIIYRGHLDLKYKYVVASEPNHFNCEECIVDEDSNNKEKHTKPVVSILYSVILAIHRTSKGFVIKTRESQMIYDLVLSTVESIADIISTIQQNFKEYTNSTLEVKTSLVREYQLRSNENLISPKSVGFSEPIQSARLSNPSPRQTNQESLMNSALNSYVPENSKDTENTTISNQAKISLYIDLSQVASPRYLQLSNYINVSDSPWYNNHKESQASQTSSLNDIQVPHNSKANCSKSSHHTDNSSSQLFEENPMHNSDMHQYKYLQSSRYCQKLHMPQNNSHIESPMNSQNLKKSDLFPNFSQSKGMLPSYLGESSQISLSHLSPANLRRSEDIKVSVLYKLYFHYRAHKVLEDGELFPLVIGLTDNYLHEFDFKDGSILQKYNIIAIESISQAPVQPKIQIIFKDMTMVTYTLSKKDQQEIAANILTLIRERQGSTISFYPQKDFLHSKTPNFRNKVRGWNDSEPDAEYQNVIIRKFCAAEDDKQFYKALNEFNLNGNVKSTTAYDPKAWPILARYLRKNIEILKEKSFTHLWELVQKESATCEEEITPLKVVRENSSLRGDYRTIWNNPTKKVINKTEKVISEESPTSELTTCKVLITLFWLEEILKAMIILLNSAVYYKEFATKKVDTKMHQEMLLDILYLLNSQYQIQNHLAAYFLRAFINFPDISEKKIEKFNRKFLLSERINIMYFISKNLITNVLVSNKDRQKYEACHSIVGCLILLRVLICEKKDSMDIEDRNFALAYICKPYFLAIFNFLIQIPLITAISTPIILINYFFKTCERGETVKIMQRRCFENSTLFLFHMIQKFCCASESQRKLSLAFLYNILKDNNEVCQLIKRIFPDYMLKKVENAPEDLAQWNLNQWVYFFAFLKNDFSTPLEQWNYKCRDELIVKLAIESEDLLKNLASCPEDRVDEVLAGHGDNQGLFLLNLSWNHEEFEVSYETLELKTRVGKYFLSALLDEEREHPRLTVDIPNPSRFWNELNIRFMNTCIVTEMTKILKTMILVYAKYHKDIGEVRGVDYYLKCSKDPFYLEVRYYILQFIYSFLSIKEFDISSKNKKNLVYANGILTLSDVLSCLFFHEDHNEEYDINLDVIPLNNLEGSGINYTTLNLKKHFNQESLKTVNMIFLILNAFKILLQGQQNFQKSLEKVEKVLYPHSPAKKQITEPYSLQCIINLLLLNDDDLILEAIELIGEYILDPFTKDFLIYETPLIEFLFFNINSKTLTKRLYLILRLYKFLSASVLPTEDNFQKYLESDFSLFASEITQRASLFFPITAYLPKRLLWLLFNGETAEFIRIFFSGSYESPDLIWNSSMRQSLQITLSTNIQPYKQDLVDFRSSLEVPTREKMPIYQKKAIGDVYPNLQDEIKCGPIFLRIWNRKAFREFKLQQYSVNRFIQSLYTLINTYQFTLPQSSGSQKSSPRLKHLEELGTDENFTFKRNLSCHTLENTNKPFNDMLVVLEAHAKAIKRYKIHNYQCFREILDTLEHFSANLMEVTSRTHNEGPSPYEMTYCILVICRIIHHAVYIDHSENIDSFINAGGLEILLRTIPSVTKHMNINRYGSENYSAFLDLRLLDPDIKILSLIVLVVKLIIIERPQELLNLSNEVKQQMFLGWQEALKLSVIVFEGLEMKVSRETKPPDTKKNSVNDHFEETNNLAAIHRIPSLATYESSSTAVLDMFFMESQPDLHLNKIFELTKDLQDVLIHFSSKAVFVPILIRSGIGWRCLEFITYYIEASGPVNRPEEKHYAKMIKNIENVCFVLRNMIIYASEAHLIRSKKASEDTESFLSSSQKDPQIEIDINRMTESAVKIMARFYANILNLIGQYIIKLLLTDRLFALLTPQIKDRENVDNFLKAFTSSFYDPSTLWNEEIRSELRSLMANQLLTVNNSKGKLCFNQVESFEYKAHKKYLLINKVFVSSYNKKPQWKIKEPGPFILSTFEKAASLWQDLKNYTTSSRDLHSENNDISSTLFNLNEAISAISNVITYHGSEDVLLVESRITTLATLLNDKRTKKIEDPYVVNLKITALSILTKLAKTSGGAIKLVENVTFVKNSLAVLRSNTKEGSFLADKVLKVVDSIAQYENINQSLVNYGIWLIILEFFLKTEIHPRLYRKEALKVFLGIVKNYNPNNTLSNALGFLYPPKIQQLLFLEKDLDKILDYLDNGYDSPKIIWTRLMRYELLYILNREGEIIHNIWSRYFGQEVRHFQDFIVWQGPEKMIQPIFPEIKENLCINDVYLRNFNRNPVLDDQDNLDDFLNNIVNCAEQIYDEFIEKTVNYENSGKSAMYAMTIEEQKKLDRLSCTMVTLLTSLLLGMDQVINRPSANAAIGLGKIKKPLQENKEENKNQSTQETKDLERSDELKQLPTKTLSEKVIFFVIRSMELFGFSKVHLHIFTELQMLYLLASDIRGLAYLKENDILLFLANFLRKITSFELGQSSFTHVEEKMGLYILLKLILQDSDLIFEAFHECLEPLSQILKGNKSYLKDITQNILAVMVEHPQIQEFLIVENENPLLLNVSNIENLNPPLLLEYLWKPLSQGFQPYQAKNILSAVRKKSKDSKLEFPAISDFSFVSLPHMSGDNLKHEQTIRQYISKIVEENSDSKDCMNTN